MYKISSVKSKHINNFYLLNEQFGNRVLLWNSISSFRKSGYNRNVTIRYSQPGGLRFFNVSPKDLDYYISKYEDAGLDTSKIIVNQDLCDAALYNCEVTLTHLGLCVGFVNISTGIHKNSRNLDYLYGLQAKLFLQKYMDASSYEDLQVLLEKWNDHVIEISILSKNMGNIPNRNTIFWEVRKY